MKLAGLTNLTSLNLRGVRVTDIAIPHLSNLLRLSRLGLKFCPLFDGSGFMSWTMGTLL
jgi:Leucine-rich repeat (LRR) protein